MNIVFIGGGSLRILPVLRGVFDEPEVIGDGEIRLVDLNLESAEMVAGMIRKTPEYKNVNCKIIATTNLDQALEGADVLYITMEIGPNVPFQMAQKACFERNFMGSDQISLSGAMLALIGGTTILGFARKMERICPNAKLLTFANPVPVYSAMVNNHTSIDALGICAGYKNHRFDISRLMGRNEVLDYDVIVAGINHFSFILEGTFEGEDIYKVLGRHLTNDWKPLDTGIANLDKTLCLLKWMYDRFGKIIFSTEGDGFSHLCPEKVIPMYKKLSRAGQSLEEVQKFSRNKSVKRDQRYADFKINLEKDLDADFWDCDWYDNQTYGKDKMTLGHKIFRAMAGLGEEKIVASAPNNGAVEGFSDRTVLEYSMMIDKNWIRPVKKLVMPEVFRSLIDPLAAHQTMLGDAIATQDPKLFADAMYIYPVQYNTQNSRELLIEMLDIYKGIIPEVFQQARDYIF